MKRPLLDTSCLVCGERRTTSGFICPPCYVKRYGTIHAHWSDPWYISAMQDAAERIEKRTAQQAASKRRAAERREAA